MKRTPIKKVSDKHKKKLQKEAKLVSEMLVQCQGKCMLCGRSVPLEKNHTRDRKRFVLSCRSCHSPGGEHRYLDDTEPNNRITCPFCGDGGFDKLGLKNHLSVFCKDYDDIELVRGYVLSP